MKSFKYLAHEMITKVEEDAPANAVGSGANVALPPTHEPGVKKKKKKKDPILMNTLKRKVEENNDNNSTMLKGVLDKLEQLDTIVDEKSGRVQPFSDREIVREREYQTFKDKYVNTINESSTKAAFDMEAVIVSAAGGPKFTSKLIPNSDEVGKRIVKTLRLEGEGGKFPPSNPPASAEWAKYFAPDKPKGSTLTPKTDFLIGRRRVSLKTGDAILMSGERKEATATFYTALDRSGSVNKAVSQLKKHIDNLLPSTDMTKYNVKGSKTDLEKQGKFAEIEILKRADEAHQAMKTDMRNVFSNNPNFAREFTFEAMTGKVKFGNNVGTADHFLVTDFEGRRPTIHQVTSSGDAYVSKIMKFVKPDVTFKSGSKKQTIAGKQTKTGYYTFWSAVKVGIKMITEEEIKNADLLTEGVFDVVKRIFARAITYIKNFFNKIYDKISQSFKDFIEFMDFEPQVRFNNRVSW
jgi:hypothetical protein